MNKKISILSLRLLLAFLFLFTQKSLASGPAADYLCELGAAFYSMGRYEDALSEFNKALLVDPDSQTAKRYINDIFKQSLNPSPAEDVPTVEENPIVLEASQARPALKNTYRALSKDEIMEQTMDVLQPGSNQRNTSPYGNLPQELKQGAPDEKTRLTAGPLYITGKMQLGFGVTPEEFIWKRANFDLNEKLKSWRPESEAGFNRKFNTYDPRVYDSLSVNLDTDNKTGFNFHTNVTVDPWSFTGKSSKVSLINSNGVDRADNVEIRYWSNTGYTVNSTVYSTTNGLPINLPEMKVVKGSIVSPNTANNYNIPEMKIYRQFQPFRELWLDYANEQLSLRVFPIAYQDQAFTSDDPLAITNRHIWWQDSPWLRRYLPGNFNSGNVPVDFTKGRWDDSFSFLTKDSTGKYLTALRGISLDFNPQEESSFHTTLATPKDLWQNYETVDNVISASRLKQYLADNLMIGGTLTARLGYKTDPGTRIDSQNYVGGVDLSYELAEGYKAQAEVLTSKSYYDTSNSQYETDAQGNAYYFSFITRYPRQSIMDLKNGFDEINMEKDETFLVKSKFYFARMDTNFDQSLSNFHNTRQDTFWSRHIHFRKPFEYYFEGLEDFRTSWGELNSTRIGDGIDNGRNVVGFRLYTVCNDVYENLFDIRNVHNVNGKFIENVVRDELTVNVTDKLTAKGLAIYHKLPKTLGGTDPFIYSGDTGEFWLNSAVEDGKNPTTKTGSFGLNYDFFDWLSVDGIYERTNDYSLAYGDFPRNTLRDDTSMGGSYYQNNNLYRTNNPFLFDQGLFPQAPYEFYNVFKAGCTFRPMKNLEVYLDYTRNEFEIAGQNSDSMNHIGTEIIFMPFKKAGLALRYTYSRWKDIDRLQAGITEPLGHHNFSGEFRYLPSKDDEFIMQYGEGNMSPIGNMTLDPYGGSNLALDTQHIIRAYYRRKF